MCKRAVLPAGAGTVSGEVSTHARLIPGVDRTAVRVAATPAPLTVVADELQKPGDDLDASVQRVLECFPFAAAGIYKQVE